MKHLRTLLIISIIAAMALCLTACGTFSFTAVGDKTTIEVTDAKDGDTTDYEAIALGKNNVVNISSELEKGQLKIDFYEAINTKVEEDDDDDYVLGDIAETITVGPGDTMTLPLNEGDYVLTITAVGETGGNVVLKVE